MIPRRRRLSPARGRAATCLGEAGNGQAIDWPRAWLILTLLVGLGLAPHRPVGAVPPPFRPPIRAVAVADVVDLKNGTFAVYEFLEIYNDDYNRPLTVSAARGDSWVGRRRVLMDEEWLPGGQAVVIPPASVRRVAQRQRIVTGYPLRNWWVRWLRFTIQTDRGPVISNFISSPMRPPTVIVSDVRDGDLDAWSSPPGHASAPTHFREPWRTFPEDR